MSLPRSFFLNLIEKDFSEFQAYLEKSSDKEVRELLKELHPADIADIVEQLSEANRSRLMDLMTAEEAADVLALVEEHHQGGVVEAIPEEKLPKIIDEMHSDDATDILEELPEEEAEEILEALPAEDSAPVRKLLEYSEDSAGGLMQAELIRVKPDSTLAEAAQTVRFQSKKVEDVQNIYVVDDKGVLLGSLPIQALILEAPEKKVCEVMEKKFFSVKTDVDQEEVVEMFRKYDLFSLPVTDPSGVLLGRILVDDVVDVIQEEASEDIYRLAGTGLEEHVTDSPFRSMRLRLPWLLFNTLTAILAAVVVGFFQDTLQRMVILAVFMPVVAGLGGNAGTQSLAVITRGLALGEATFNNAKKILFKELLAGVLNGILVGGLMAVVAYFYAGSAVLGGVLGLALICNLFVAALAGTAIPLVLKWAKVDPALASGVIVTTCTDVAGFFSFLGLATLLMAWLV